MPGPDRGRLTLFTNENYKSENHPTKTGMGEISRGVINQLVELSKDMTSDDETVKLDCACWPKTSKGGKPYVFIIFGPKEEYNPAGADGPGTNKGSAPVSAADIPF
jgi:hypothetical protein